MNSMIEILLSPHISDLFTRKKCMFHAEKLCIMCNGKSIFIFIVLHFTVKNLHNFHIFYQIFRTLVKANLREYNKKKNRSIFYLLWNTFHILHFKHIIVSMCVCVCEDFFIFENVSMLKSRKGGGSSLSTWEDEWIIYWKIFPFNEKG